MWGEKIIAATYLSLSTRGPMFGRPPDSIGRSEEGVEKGGKRGDEEGEGMLIIISYDDLWPWNWTTLSTHSGLGGTGLFSVLFPRRQLCFAHRQAVLVLERPPGSSD